MLLKCSSHLSLTSITHPLQIWLKLPNSNKMTNRIITNSLRKSLYIFNLWGDEQLTFSSTQKLTKFNSPRSLSISIRIICQLESVSNCIRVANVWKSMRSTILKITRLWEWKKGEVKNIEEERERRKRGVWFLPFFHIFPPASSHGLPIPSETKKLAINFNKFS